MLRFAVFLQPCLRNIFQTKESSRSCHLDEASLITKVTKLSPLSLLMIKGVVMSVIDRLTLAAAKGHQLRQSDNTAKDGPVV